MQFNCSLSLLAVWLMVAYWSLVLNYFNVSM